MSGGSTSAMPYIGSKISLITNSELRYEGTLVNINTSNSTVTLQNVHMSGTENRRAPHFVLPSSEIFDYIVFNGKDIKDLTVSEPGFSVKEDPAVVAVNIAPPAIQQQQQRMAARSPLMMSRGGVPPPHMMMDSRGYSPPPGRGGYLGNNRRMEYHHDGGRNRNNNNNPRGVVGELSAQPNSNLKTQVATNFNFEESNSKFQKDAAVEGARTVTAPVYDKSASFFDNISCETLNRQHGRDSKIDRERQRELDTETFGSAAAVSRGPKYYRRGYRRGGARGGRMAYNGMMMRPSAAGPTAVDYYGGVGYPATRYGKHIRAVE